LKKATSIFIVPFGIVAIPLVLLVAIGGNSALKFSNPFLKLLNSDFIISHFGLVGTGLGF
jgi:hypothetical protein